MGRCPHGRIIAIRNIIILDGEFDASGLITGTIAYNLDSFNGTANGILTGLIGQEGRDWRVYW